MLSLLLSVWILILSLTNKNERKFFSVGAGTFLYAIVKNIRNMHFLNDVLLEMLYWIEILLLMYTVIHFAFLKKERIND